VLGPKILLLMPAWLSGVLVYRAINRPLVLPPVLAWSLAVLPPVVYVTMLWASMPKMLLVLTWLVLGTDGVLSLGFSDEFLWNALIGGMVAAHFIGIAALLRDREAREGSGARLIRWLAGASFSLYLVHYPALQLFDALLPDMPEMLRNALLLISTLAVAFAFAELFERTLGVQRAGLRRMVVAAASWLRPASRDPLAMTAE
jgi:peptidoglycan/LPS O-acetylase OafA/YrhL